MYKEKYKKEKEYYSIQKNSFSGREISENGYYYYIFLATRKESLFLT